MTTFGAWTRAGSDRVGRVHRCYELFGSDAVIRDDCVLEIISRAGVSCVDRVCGSEMSSAGVWDLIGAVPFGRKSRAVIVRDAHRVMNDAILSRWLSDRSRHADTVIILVSERADRGCRVRNRQTDKWETELAAWQRVVSDSSAAAVIDCATPTVEVVGSTRGAVVLSPAARWLSRRVPVTQRQAEYLWRRVGGSTSLARDVLDALFLLGVADATVLGVQDFIARVDMLVTAQGAESLVEDLLFNRKSSVSATLSSRDLGRGEWSKVIGLLSQRLEWLGPLYHALSTRESLSVVSSNIKIHEKWILHYAHRDVPEHNIARFYNPTRVAACRRLLATLDAALSRCESGVPVGFGEVLVSGW